MKKLLLVTALTACLAGAALVPGPLHSGEKLPFTEEELAKLAKGEAVIRLVEKELSDGEVSSLLVSAVLVRHPPEVIWEVLNHPEREVEWIPGVKKSELVSDTCPTLSTRVNTTDYRLGFWGVEIYYSTIREYDYEKKTIKARLDQDRPHRFLKKSKAGWDFFPFEGGTIFQYWSQSELVVDIKVPFVSDALAERTLIAGVEAVAERCDQIALEMKKKKPAPVCPVKTK